MIRVDYCTIAPGGGMQVAESTTVSTGEVLGQRVRRVAARLRRDVVAIDSLNQKVLAVGAYRFESGPDGGDHKHIARGININRMG